MKLADGTTTNVWICDDGRAYSISQRGVKAHYHIKELVSCWLICIAYGGQGVPCQRFSRQTFYTKANFSNTEVDHIDNDRSRCHVSNLQYLTREENLLIKDKGITAVVVYSIKERQKTVKFDMSESSELQRVER